MHAIHNSMKHQLATISPPTFFKVTSFRIWHFVQCSPQNVENNNNNNNNKKKKKTCLALLPGDESSPHN